MSAGRPPSPRRLPLTRAECVDGPRPCPYVSCRHHLYLDVDGRGAVRMFAPLTAYGAPDMSGMRETCSLDVADRKEPLESKAIGDLIGVREKMVERNQMVALEKLAQTTTPAADDFERGAPELFETDDADESATSWADLLPTVVSNDFSFEAA